MFHVGPISIRREAIYLTRALAEACVITPWLTALASLYQPVAILAMASIAFAVILGTAYTLRLMGVAHLSVRLQRAVAAATILAITLWALYSLGLIPHQWPDRAWLLSALQPLTDLSNVLPPGLAVALVMAFLWWRGLRLAQQSLNLAGVALGFHLGVLLFAVFLIVTVGSPQVQEDITPCIIAFFFCQLLAISLTRVESMGEQPGGRRSPFSSWWAMMLTWSTGTIITIAGATYGLIRGVGPDRILGWLAPVLAIILIPFYVLLGPLLSLLMMILEPIMIALLTLTIRLGDLLATFQAMSNAPLPDQPYQRAPAVEIVMRALGCGKGTLVLAVSLLILIGVFWAIRRAQASRPAIEDEQRESVWSAGWWLARLRRRLGQRLKRVASAASLLSRLGLGGLFTALTIRRIYAQLQKLAARRGYPRQPARTPYEYLPVLYECFEGYQLELDRLTEAYVKVHYGELPESQADLTGLRAAWDRLRASEPKIAQRSNVKRPT